MGTVALDATDPAAAETLAAFVRACWREATGVPPLSAQDAHHFSVDRLLAKTGRSAG